MPITPSGPPLWARTVEAADYGGNTEKQNYMNRSGIDALTDVNAEQFARLTADAVAFARTAPFAVLSWQCRDTPTAKVPTVKFANMPTGTRLVSYDGDAPPVGFPSVTRVGDGAVEITFASEYASPYGVVAPFEIRMVMASGNASSVVLAVDEIVDAQTVRVRIYDAVTKAAAPDVGGTLQVW